MSKLKVTACPSCGSKKIKEVCKTVRGTRQGKPYAAPKVEFYECPDCGERVYDSLAIRQIEKHSSAPARQRSSRKIA